MINYLYITNAIVKCFILVMSLYAYSQVYQGIFLTIVGIMGIGWVLSEYYNEYRFYKLFEEPNKNIILNIEKEERKFKELEKEHKKLNSKIYKLGEAK